MNVKQWMFLKLFPSNFPLLWPDFFSSINFFLWSKKKPQKTQNQQTKTKQTNNPPQPKQT